MADLRAADHGDTGEYFISVCNIQGCPRNVGLLAGFCWMATHSPLYSLGLGVVVTNVWCIRRAEMRISSDRQTDRHRLPFIRLDSYMPA